MSQTLDFASAAALAELASRRLARDAVTNFDLREALQTSRSQHGVRIGECEISYREEQGERIFDIATDDGKTISDVAFYETARYLVYRLNSGARLSAPDIAETIKVNLAYHKARDDVRQHAERVIHYSEVGNTFKADLHEDRFSRASARCKMLRARLLEVQHPYM